MEWFEVGVFKACFLCLLSAGVKMVLRPQTKQLLALFMSVLR